MATAVTASTLSSLSSLYLHKTPCLSLLKPIKPFSLTLKSPSFLVLSSRPATITTTKSSGSETVFFEDPNPQDEFVFDPPTPPEGFIPPPYFDEVLETEDEVTLAYEKLYGPAFSGVSQLGNDIYVMDSQVQKVTGMAEVKKEKVKDGFEERVVEVRRVTKVIKGGRQLNYRALVVVGDKQGKVGVGVGKARDVVDAVEKSAYKARRNLITVPITKYKSFPHRSEAKYGAAKVMLRPAVAGGGVIAGGSVKVVLELAGIENALGKQLLSKNLVNNAKATIIAIRRMKQFTDVARERGIPMEELWK